MELSEKLQELRRKKGVTQEEVATAIFVSRTAVSKWESGRGYPNIDSLKNLANYYGVTIDELLSTQELIAAMEEENKQTKKHFRDLVFGLIDISVILLFILPLFALRSGNAVQSVSLSQLSSVKLYVKIIYYFMVCLVVLFGVLTLSLQNFNAVCWQKSKVFVSLILSALLVIVFIITLQPYAAIFSLVLLIIKGLILIKR